MLEKYSFPHRIYTMYNSDMQSLYVGCTNSLKDRIPAHKHKHWYNSIFYIEFSKQFIYRDNALDYERKTITSLQPLHNIRSKVNASMNSYYKGEHCVIALKGNYFWSDFFTNRDEKARLELIKAYKMESDKEVIREMRQQKKTRIYETTYENRIKR